MTTDFLTLKDRIEKAVEVASVAYFAEPNDCRARDGIVGMIQRILMTSENIRKTNDRVMVSVDHSPELIDKNEIRGTIVYLERFYGEPNDDAEHFFTFAILPAHENPLVVPKVEVKEC